MTFFKVLPTLAFVGSIGLSFWYNHTGDMLESIYWLVFANIFAVQSTFFEKE